MNKKLLILLLIVLAGRALFAQTMEQEAPLKAAFIYNFTRYIEWTNSGNNSSNFVIGVVGNSDVVPALREIARTNTVQGKKIVIVIYDKPENIGFCHFLFIPAGSGFPLSSILDNTGKGVLTISESSGYARRGTGINFILVNNKIKFEANLTAIYASGLKAGSQLLKLAIIVD